MQILRFLKNWTLPVAIVAGAVAYLIYAHLPVFDSSRPYAPKVVAVVQPTLIFCMLFLTFCKIDIRSLRLRRVHLWMLLIQCGFFALASLLLHFVPQMPGRVVLEGAMLCMICPTATSAAVVTMKLHGDAADITTYTILINLAVAITVPLLLPLIGAGQSASFATSFALILGKVFPLLLCPLIAAQLIRVLVPRVLSLILRVKDLAFYLWAVALSIAIAVTVRAIAHTTHPASELIGIALASLVCCIVQFAIGRTIGTRSGFPVSTAQSLGQKNTVFAIWMGYTFMNPVTSIAGGFYSVWHNLYNTWQLRREARSTPSDKQ